MAHQLSGNSQFDAVTDPFTTRMPFASVINRLLNGPKDAAKRKSHRNLLENMSHAELADLGLQRKFNGSTWYIDRMSNELPARGR